jgi:hypothetical protein
MTPTTTSLLITVVLALAGCLPRSAYECAGDASCGTGGTCQPTGYCSFADPDCASGQRYHGSAAGDLADLCVDGTDGGTPDTAATCAHSPCLEGAPLGECACSASVCAQDAYCCTSAWDLTCIKRAEILCDVACSGYLAVACGTNVGQQPSRVYHVVSPSNLMPVFTTPAARSFSIAAWGDLDGDGDADLAIGAIFGDLPAVYENGAGHAFIERGDIAEGGNTTSVAWGDVDGDRDLDLAVANFAQSTHVLRNQGGSLAAAYSTPAEAVHEAQSITWVDYDGDRDLDFFIANVANAANQLFRNDGGGGFSVDSRFPTIAESSWIAAWGDHDGDGDRDLVVGNVGAPNRVYRNTDGVLAEVWNSADAEETRGAAWGDFDGDGDLDLAFANDGAPARVLRNDGGDVFTPVWSSPTALGAWSVAWGDHDDDGDLDLAIGARDRPARIYQQLSAGVFDLVWTAEETGIGAGVAFGPDF